MSLANTMSQTMARTGVRSVAQSGAHSGVHCGVAARSHQYHVSAPTSIGDTQAVATAVVNATANSCGARVFARSKASPTSACTLLQSQQTARNQWHKMRSARRLMSTHSTQSTVEPTTTQQTSERSPFAPVDDSAATVVWKVLTNSYKKTPQLTDTTAAPVVPKPAWRLTTPRIHPVDAFMNTYQLEIEALLWLLSVISKWTVFVCVLTGFAYKSPFLLLALFLMWL